MSCCEENNPPKPTEHSLVQAGKSIIKHFTDVNYNAFLDEESQNARMEICKSCESITERLGSPVCGVCGCFLVAKVKLESQMCPHPNGNKWK